MQNLGLLVCIYCVTLVSTLGCPTCLDENCAQNGECRTGCRSGYVGHHCKDECPRNCRSSTCHVDRASGTYACSDGCRDGYCGIQCKRNCPDGCTTCDRSTCSICNITVCQEGFFSSNCQERCNPSYGECDKDTGKCIKCSTGYFGDHCEEECPPCLSRHIDSLYSCASGCVLCDSEESEEYGNDPVPIALIAGIAGIAVIAVCILVITFVTIKRRRKRQRRGRGKHPELQYDNQKVKDTYKLLPLSKETKTDVTGTKQIQLLRDKAKEKISRFTEGMIHIRAVDLVIKKMKAGQKWITIIGNAGDGKTTLGYLVLGRLQTKMRVYIISKPEEYKCIERLNEERVILLDDRFGSFTSDQSFVKDWVTLIKSIINSQENSSKIEKQTYVIFVSRKNVVKESLDCLGNYRYKFFNPECVVDLGAIKETDERLKILEYHLHRENVSIDLSVKERVADLQVAHGFPHCCKLYSALRSRGYNIDIEEFFRSPLKFLDMTTRILYDENCKNLFELMVKNDGKFDILQEEDKDKRQALLKVQREQEGSYIMVLDGICEFSHPAIYESVLSTINDADPLFCVQSATLPVIRQKMVISDSEDKDRFPCYIIVKPYPAVLKALALRFRSALQKGDYSVFGHRFCENKEFCEAIVSNCVCKGPVEDRERQNINVPGNDGDTMMWRALRSANTTAVYTLVKHGADVNIKDQKGLTPLHYLCVDQGRGIDTDIIDFIITEGTVLINLCDPHGRTSLHCLCEGPVINVEAIQLLINKGKGDVNRCDENGSTPLHYVCRLKCLNVNLIQWMIEKGNGDINKQEKNKSTPLHSLCEHRCVDLKSMPFIITHGRNGINKGDEHGNTPLHYLCRNEAVDVQTILQVIIRLNGDINIKDNNGTTPFHHFCKRSLDIGSIQSLIKEGKVQINQADQYGNTPLHYLCRREGTEVHSSQLNVRQIPGADLTNRNIFGKTPLDYITEEGEKLPWADGIVERSVSDLVVCKLKDEQKWKHVLGPAMTLSAEQAHCDITVQEGNRELTNMEKGGIRKDQFSVFTGTSAIYCNLLPLSCLRYWEINSWLKWKTEADWPLLETGLGVEMDSEMCVSRLPQSWCVSVLEFCPNHRPKLCVKVYNDNKPIGDCITLCRPTHGNTFSFTLGLVLDVEKGRLGLIDLERGKILNKCKKRFQGDIVPLFYVYPHNDCSDVRTRLVSGREITVTDNKIKLIQEVLSD